MKNVQIFFLFFLIVMIGLITGCNQGKKEVKEESAAPSSEEKVLLNALTEKEIADGWVLLFDGKSLEGWRGYGMDKAPEAWSVVDGTLFIKGSGTGEAHAETGGDLIYDKKFKNFRLKLEYKVSEGGNSGIFYLAKETPELDRIWKSAPEFQILDNERHPDAMLGVDGNRMSASLYDLIPAKPQNTKPAGEWNSVEILVYDGTVAHFQNGEKVLEYHLWTPSWNEMVANSKFPEYSETWADVAKEGYFGLQDHGHDIWFRNIKILEM